MYTLATIAGTLRGWLSDEFQVFVALSIIGLGIARQPRWVAAIAIASFIGAHLIMATSWWREAGLHVSNARLLNLIFVDVAILGTCYFIGRGVRAAWPARPAPPAQDEPRITKVTLPLVPQPGSPKGPNTQATAPKASVDHVAGLKAELDQLRSKL